MIYLITSPQNQACKIGYSKNPVDRLSSLQQNSSMSLHLQAVIHGKMKQEFELHKQFAHLQIRGEWYVMAPEIIDFFQSHPDKTNVSVRVPLTKAVQDTIRDAVTHKRTFRVAMNASSSLATVSIWNGVFDCPGQISNKNALVVIQELRLVEYRPGQWKYEDNELFKVIVAGSRDFNQYQVIEKKLDFILQAKLNIEIVSGKCLGVDKMGERFAKERNLPVAGFPADWNQHKKAAGPIRNRQMAEYADAAVCFWDGKSKGTLNMIDTMKALSKPVKVIRI